MKQIGSSPRLRGTEHRPMADQPPGRFIPAPAGNSLDQFWNARPHEVHPRACGEQKGSVVS